MSRYAAFISYAHRYIPWVRVLHANLERCLAHCGRPGKVFLDEVDLGTGRSWVGQLQAGLDSSERVVLIATPEALASPRVADEVDAKIAHDRSWRDSRFQVVLLVDAPLPPFLELIQFADFREHDAERYRRALRELVGALIGHTDKRALPELPAEIEIPDPPTSSLPSGLRSRLVEWLTPVLERQGNRRNVAGGLGMERTALDNYPSWASAASAAIVKATGDDDPLTAAVRITGVLYEELHEDLPDQMASLEALRAELAALRERAPEEGLLGVWKQKVSKDHDKLVPVFQQRHELDLLDRVYVRLELRPEARFHLREEGGRPLEGSLSLRDLLRLDPKEHPWVTRRWVVLGDPGAGKTTLLRHLAASLARELRAEWVPIFESLPRLMREREFLLERIARQLARAGYAAQGLPAVLERAAQEGRLLLLLDGLDEVPKDDRADAESLLRDFSSRWPATSIVVTSRPIGYRRPDNDFCEVEVQPLDRERRAEFLARWFGRATGARDEAAAARALGMLGTDPSLLELASNPLYLTLMALLIERGHSPERNRTELYDQVFKLLLEGGHRPAGEPIDCQEAVRQLLRQLGYQMTRENRDAEPVTALEARLYRPDVQELCEKLERVPRWRRSLRPFLDELAERTSILGPHDGPDSEWRFWHRTFREALAAERLVEVYRGQGGQEEILKNATEIAGDESRWAEPYALLVGRVEQPDELVRALVGANQALGLRALATAQRLEDATLTEILQLSEKAQERAEVYERLPELIGESERALALLDRLRRRTRNGNDLFFLDRAVGEVASRWPEHGRRAEELQSRLFDHIPAPADPELFRTVITGRGDQVPLWRRIPEGVGWIGSPKGVGHDDERPRHQVEIVRPFALAAVPVTNAQYAAFDPAKADLKKPQHPVVNITWYEAMSFCRWLVAQVPGCETARLPTEEEWEYACRAGSETAYWRGDDESQLAEVGWYSGNSERHLHSVGEKLANKWGLYDMHGNVWEWTASVWDSEKYKKRSTTEPLRVDPAEMPADLAAPGGERVLRGGGYWVSADRARSAFRSIWSPAHGFGSEGFRVLLSSAPSDP